MKSVVRFLMIAAVATVAGEFVQAQKNWTAVGNDEGHTKFSTLNQINTTNVKNLERAWTFHTGDSSGFFESTPLVIDGRLFLNAGTGFFALEPETGKQIWKYEATNTTRRGLSYWPGDANTPGRLIGSTGNKLVALDPKTGQPVKGFGDEGFVDMGTGMNSPASIYKNLIITPANRPIIRAWDARDGHLVWTFNLIAQPGDPGHDTWETDVWKTIGGTNVWGYLSVDEARGTVFIPNSIAGSDYVGIPRPGNNAYGTSVVAIDANTGKLKWYQQLVHHDIWDYDLAAAPSLVEVVKAGKRIPAIAVINKMGLLFMFDRVTGTPVHGMEERPVPQSTVPGEKTSPTQPFPLKPAPLARNSMKKADLPTTISPEHTAYCAALWDKYKLQDSVPYTPWGVGQDVVVYPGAIGGGNWNGVAVNKPLNLIITNIMNAGQWGHMEQGGGGGRGRGGRGGDPAAAGRGGVDEAVASPTDTYRKVTPEGGRFWDPKTMYSCVAPPWGELVAVNANTGDIAWHVPLGAFPELEAKGIKTGTPSLGGAITTAGNLVFIGATTDSMFRAFDARNGKELWKVKVDVPAHSIPSTFMGRDGRQYVVLPVGGGGFLRSATSDAVIAFALPKGSK